jgi:sugar porter (SP) family MFS transporter
MSSEEKHEVAAHLDDVNGRDVAEVKVVKGDEAFAQAMLKEPPKTWSGRSFVLYLCAIVAFFCSTCNGFDGSMFNALLAMDQFKDYFKVENDGAWTGIVTSMYSIGSVVAIPFIGPAIDTWGRKVGIYIGATSIVLGTIVQSTTLHSSNAIGQFMGGRFLLGFGVGIVASAGPTYVVETSHPAHRGVVTAFYNTFWFVGSILASGSARGSAGLTGNKAWQIPVWLQCAFPGLCLILTWALPESPRWQYVNGKREKAKEMLTWYHGEGNPDSVWVQMQLREYEEYLEVDGADKRWWDYRALFKDRASRYRLACNCTIAIFGQWSGNGPISYFISAVLDTAGITDSITQLNLNLGLNIMQFALALFGATLVDKVGRRPLLLFANIGCSIVWIGATISSSINADTGSKSSGSAVVAMIFLFDAVFSVGFTPLQALYPVEVLSFEMRAKGMAFSNLAVSAATLVNQFAYPVALKQIKWKTYLVFVLWCPIQAAVIYFFIPETKNRTLEELDDIFHAKNPRKASLEKKKIALDEDANIVKAEAVA